MHRTATRTRPEASPTPTLQIDRERVAYHLRTAEGWSDLQARLQPLGLEVERRGQNLVLTNGGKAEVKLGDVARGTSARQLELRLGAFDTWRGQVTELQERLREATATQLEIRQLDTNWRRATGLAERLEDRLETARSHSLDRARLDDRLDGLLTKIYRPADLEHARTRLTELRQDLGDHRALARLERRPEELGRLRGHSLPLGIETPTRVQAHQALDETRHVLGKLGQNQLVGQQLDRIIQSAPDRLAKLRDHAREIAHHRFDLTTQKEIGLGRIGELAKILGPRHLDGLAERAVQGMPQRVAGATAGKAATAATTLMAKTNVALSIVKTAIDYVERAGERER